MILGIFYARFFPQEGTKIVAQSPPGCMVADEEVKVKGKKAKQPLVAFEIVQEYLTPRKAFMNRFLTVNSPDNKYTILGFPVSIPHQRYQRNEFIFNFGLVVEADSDQIPYERLVRRLAVTFAEMERQGSYLSSERSPGDGRRPIGSLLEIVKEDLNNYGECMIPIDEANTLNMKLFPYHPPPPPVRGWHVPVPKVKLTAIMDSTWDLTLQRIIPHVDGVNDVRRIAWLADVSLPLTQTALQHLVYYDTILLLDLFFFASCYAPRPAIHDFIANNDGLVDECARYVCLGHGFRSNSSAATGAGAGAGGDHQGGRRGSGSEAGGGDAGPGPGPHHLSHYQLVKLMTTFCVGRSVMEWIKLHQDTYGLDVLRHVDVRRLVQFGVIKGLLYRVHKYVVSKTYLGLLATGQARPLGDGDGDDGGGGDDESTTTKTTTTTTTTMPEGLGDPLQRYTDGCHCFDQIITEQNMTDGEIMDKLKSFPAPIGDLTVFYR